jgi:hypothetical protein
MTTNPNCYSIHPGVQEADFFDFVYKYIFLQANELDFGHFSAVNSREAFVRVRYFCAGHMRAYDLAKISRSGKCSLGRQGRKMAKVQ